MTQSFDIIYWPSVLASPVQMTVLRRDVEAIGRAHALLWWVWREFDQKVDPVEMFDGSREFQRSCGCSLSLSFYTMRQGRLERLTKTPVMPVAVIEGEPCEAHEQGGPHDPRGGGYWHGEVGAFGHDPQRPDVFVDDE